MKLTNRSEYALLALAVLAREYSQGFVSADEIIKKRAIPKRFLQQILFNLKRGGFIKSHKGQDGGYRLARAPEEISIAEIVRFFEGALAPTAAASKYFYEESPIEQESGMIKLFTRIRNDVSNILETTNLAEVSGLVRQSGSGRIKKVQARRAIPHRERN